MSSEQLKRAYELGWLAAASWTLADDIVHDVGSPAYNDERDARLRTLLRPTEHRGRELVPVAGHTLGVTHICGGEEVVTGGIDGQVYIATFVSHEAAELFVRSVHAHFPIKGYRVPEL